MEMAWGYNGATHQGRLARRATSAGTAPREQECGAALVMGGWGGEAAGGRPAPAAAHQGRAARAQGKRPGRLIPTGIRLPQQAAGPITPTGPGGGSNFSPQD